MRLTLAVACFVACLGAGGGEADDPATASGRHRPMPPPETVLVERVKWPVLVRGEGCNELAPKDLTVTEDGVARKVHHIDHEPVATLHVLLIDTSFSMKDRDRLDLAKRAASEYIEELRPGDEILVLTFDESTRMLVPRTVLDSKTARRGALRAIAEVRETDVGELTHLHDAIHLTASYLARYPGRKALVVFTDGVDGGSLVRKNERLDPLGGAVRGQDLAVFLIGMKLKLGSGSGRSILERLAHETGGVSLSAATASKLPKVFGKVRDLLEGGVTVVFENVPSDSVSEGERAVEIESEKKKCEIVAFKRTRQVDAGEGGDGGRWPWTPRVQPFLAGMEPLALYERGYRQQEDGVSFPSFLYALKADELADFVDPFRRDTVAGTCQGLPDDLPDHLEGAVLVQALDLDTEWGAPSQLQGIGGTRQLRVEFTPRRFLVEIPDLASLRARVRGPEDLVLGWHLRGESLTWPESCHLFSGAMLPWVTPEVGKAILYRFEDYNAWARSRAERSAERASREAMEMLAEAGFTDGESFDAAATEAKIRASWLQEVPVHEVAAPLVSWLGDVTTEQLYWRLEQRIANALLGHAEGALEGVEVSGELMREVRAKLPVWFGSPPHQVRSLTLAGLVYDPERDAMGLYRLELPKSVGKDYPAQGVPERAMGMELLEWLLSTPSVAGELRAGYAVTSLRHGWLSRKEVRSNWKALLERMESVDDKALRKLRRSVEMEVTGRLPERVYDVSLDLRPLGVPDDTQDLRLVAYYGEDAEERMDWQTPLCLAVASEDRSSAALRLSEELHAAALPVCPFSHRALGVRE